MRARATLDMCFRNRMAWKFAGAKFRYRLLRTFDVELKKEFIEVVVKKQDLKSMKEIVINDLYEKE